MIRKLISACLVCLCLALALCASACTDKKSDNLDEFEQLLLSTDMGAESGEAFASAIYVVIPRDSGAELSARANALATLIAEKTGIKTFLKYDSEQTVEGSFEILLGYTSRLLSRENLSALRDDDYICRYDRGSVVLGGRSESATISAIQRFETDILPGASYASLMSEYAHFEVYGEYESENMTINGHSIYEYTLAYCEESSEIADILLECIKENSGYSLSSVQKNAYDAQSSKHIWLVLGGANETSISTKDGNIVLSAPDLYGLSFAAADFASKLEGGASEEAFNLSIEGSRVLDCESSSIDIAFGFADNTGDLELSLLLGLAEAIGKTESDIICFYPMDNSLINDIKLNCPSTRTVLVVEVGNGKSVPILYKTEAFSSVTAERRDGTVWISVVDKSAKSWSVRVEDASGEQIYYRGGEVLLLSGVRLDDGSIGLLASATYGSKSDKTENRVYSKSALCTKSETVAEYSGDTSYYGMLTLELIEKYHESFTILKETLE